jgi:RNA polymerase sigma-70 factor (ECF subfamily)
MDTKDKEPLAELQRSLRGGWQAFLNIYEPLRPELYRYCRYLTRSPWDAEDLAQDALARAFATLGRLGEAPPNPRAWLFRVASNLWIDDVRKRREVSADSTSDADGAATGLEPRAPREAAATLIGRLGPQERAAVVLKDVFEFSLDEIAEALSTTTGAVKAALHRGRGKLVEAPDVPGTVETRPPAAGVLDAFCAAFNARDMSRLTALLLDTASVDVVGTHTDYGPEAAGENALFGMLHGSERMAAGDPSTGMPESLSRGVLPVPPRAEVRVHRGEALLLLWYAHDTGEAVRAVNRIEADGDRIACLKNYFYSPEFLAEVCAELGVPFRSNGYHSCLAAELQDKTP